MGYCKNQGDSHIMFLQSTHSECVRYRLGTSSNRVLTFLDRDDRTLLLPLKGTDLIEVEGVRLAQTGQAYLAIGYC
jgi:hypothetical protein